MSYRVTFPWRLANSEEQRLPHRRKGREDGRRGGCDTKSQSFDSDKFPLEPCTVSRGEFWDRRTELGAVASKAELQLSSCCSLPSQGGHWSQAGTGPSSALCPQGLGTPPRGSMPSWSARAPRALLVAVNQVEAWGPLPCPSTTTSISLLPPPGSGEPWTLQAWNRRSREAGPKQ